jgi:hypothetical protein
VGDGVLLLIALVWLAIGVATLVVCRAAAIADDAPAEPGAPPVGEQEPAPPDRLGGIADPAQLPAAEDVAP